MVSHHFPFPSHWLWPWLHQFDTLFRTNLIKVSIVDFVIQQINRLLMSRDSPLATSEQNYFNLKEEGIKSVFKLVIDGLIGCDA